MSSRGNSVFRKGGKQKTAPTTPKTRSLTSSQQAAAKNQADRNARVTAAFAGAGSAANRENKIIQQNSRDKSAKILQQVEAGTLQISQSEFDKNVAIARGFLDPNTGKPLGKSQSKVGSNKVNTLLRETPREIFGTTSKVIQPLTSQITTKSNQPDFSKVSPLLRNPTGTRPAISNPDRFNNFTVTRPTITGNAEIDKIFAGQRETTILIAQEFQKRRNKALSEGKTIAEANAEAKQFVGISKDLQNAVNTSLQTDIIQQRASALKAAEQQIKDVTTGKAEAKSIKNLGDFVNNVEGSKIQEINIQTDADGKDLSPRKSKLQIENALLTGSKFEDIVFNIDVDDRIQSGDSKSNPTDSITERDLAGNVTISTDKIRELISPSALKVGLQDEDPLSFLLSQAEVSPELQKQSPLFGGDGGQVSEFVDSPTGLTPADILSGEGLTSGFDVGEANGEVTIAKGDFEIFKGNQEEAIEFINALIVDANQQNNEKLKGQLATLRDTVSKGESISLLLEQVLGILASLSSGGTGAREKFSSSPNSVSEPRQLNSFESFFGFINQIIDSVIQVIIPER